MNTLKQRVLLVMLALGGGFIVSAQGTQITNAGPVLAVVQGDTATLGAQFFDVNGNAGVSMCALHVASGQSVGQFVRDDASGELQWTCDTSTLPAGSSAMQLMATTVAGASTVVNFTLQVNEASSVQKWRQAYFGSSQDVGAALDNADPDGDGLSNRAEYAFGLNPKVGSADVGSRVESGAEAGGKMRAIFRRRSDYLTTGLSYIYEFSDDLQTWEASGVVPEILTDDGTMQSLTLEFPVMSSSGQPSRFFRTRLP